MHVFETGEWTIDLEHDRATGHLVRQIEPAGVVTVELHVLESDTDEHGRFSFEGIQSGPVALVIRFGGHEPVKSEWVIV
jgi:hypothetical protein